MFVTAQPDVAKAVPEWAQIIFGTGITLGSIAAIVLNLIFHHVGKNFGPAVAGTPGTGVIRLDQVNEMSRESSCRPSAGCSRARPGWPSGPTTSGRSPTPTICGWPSRRRCSPPTARSSAICLVLPGSGQRRRRRRQPRRGIGQGPGRRRADPAQRRGPRRVRAPDRGLPGAVRHPADRLGAGRARTATRSCKTGWERMQNAPTQEQRPPLSRWPRSSTTGSTTWSPTPARSSGARAVRMEADTGVVIAHGRRAGADRPACSGSMRCPSRRPGRPCRPASMCRAGSMRCSPSGRTAPRKQCCTGPGCRPRRSRTKRSPAHWPGIRGSVTGRRRS